MRAIKARFFLPNSTIFSPVNPYFGAKLSIFAADATKKHKFGMVVDYTDTNK